MMEEEQQQTPDFAVNTPPIAPLPPGARRRRRPPQEAVVDASPTIAESSITMTSDTLSFAPTPDHPSSHFKVRGEHFARLAEGSARALAAGEAAHRLAQQLQAVVDAYNPDDIDPELQYHVQQNIDALFATAMRLDQTVRLIADVISSEWKIYTTIFPMFQDD